MLPAKQALAASERLYRAMLILYPASFRQVYAQEMIQTFRDCCRAALQDGQRGQLTQLWGLVLGDLLLTASRERIKSGIALLYSLVGLQKEYIMLDHLLNFEIAQRTDIGRKRATNEDNMTSVIPQDPKMLEKKGALFIVSDGMGGHSHGEIASELTVKEISNAYYQQKEGDPAAALVQAVQTANQIIYKESANHKAENGMGATCVAAVVHGGTAYIANVGDSRAYIVRQGAIRQISRDHSVVADLVREGKITEEEALTHPKHNVIYRSMGTEDTVEVDLFAEAVQKGDILVLCTDGLTNLIRTPELHAIVEQYDSEESVSRLIEEANERGGTDNITAVVVRIGQAA